MRAISPSSRMISQITPEGFSPAIRARSTEASVCPARTSTPPLRARSGKTWPGRAKIADRWPSVDGRANGVRPVSGGDAGRHAFARLNRLGKRRAKARGVLLRHGKEAQMIGALLGQREADQPAAVAGHEVDGLRRHVLGGQGQVALVLAVLVVDHNHHAPGADFGQRAGNVGKGRLEVRGVCGMATLLILAHAQAANSKSAARRRRF